MGFVALSHEGKAGGSNEVGLTLSGRMVTEMGKVNPLVESAGVEQRAHGARRKKGPGIAAGAFV